MVPAEGLQTPAARQGGRGWRGCDPLRGRWSGVGAGDAIPSVGAHRASVEGIESARRRRGGVGGGVYNPCRTLGWWGARGLGALGEAGVASAWSIGGAWRGMWTLAEMLRGMVLLFIHNSRFTIHNSVQTGVEGAL
jgi:hypothetical protein